MISVKRIPSLRIACLLIAALLSIQRLQGAPPAESAPAATVLAIGARTPVRSSMLTSVGYSSSKEILELEFRSGSIYQYLNVPKPVYRELLDADSKGRFYNRRIKKHYKSKKVTMP